MLSIDLNADLGEGMPSDEALMPLISSANIACGGHAGDRESMKQTLDLAMHHGLAIGAHPSFPDKENFGRKDMIAQGLRIADLPDIIGEQLAAIREQCRLRAIKLHHVKPHGALYLRAARDAELASVICQAIRNTDPALLLYGPPLGMLKEQAESWEVGYIEEGFADRTYQEDGQLLPRSEPGALIENTRLAVQQALQIIETGTVQSVKGSRIPLQAKTICIHGDGPLALSIAQDLFRALKAKGIRIQAPGDQPKGNTP